MSTSREQGRAGTAGGAGAIPASPPRWRPRLPAGIAALLAVSLLLFAVFWLLDSAYLGRRTAGTAPLDAWQLLVALDAETLQNALGSLAQVVVAVLGIAITVVSIVVQLAATRYTPRIAEMFFRDRTNLAIMGFFVVSCINAVWVSIVVTSGFVPRATVAMTTVVVTASLLLLIPYFAYVFAFLNPEKVIARIGHQVLDAVLARGTARRCRGDLQLRQASCVAGLEHLSDIAINTLAQKDKIIATDAVTALRDFAVKYLKTKEGLPPDWFVIGPRTRGNPDFIALAPDSLLALERKQVWVEWKVLRHFRSVFAEALQHLPELGHVVAIETRYIAEEALRLDDREVLVISIRFFNTYVRTAINQADVRACYNIFHQYRLLAEHMMRKGHTDLVLESGRCIAYYSQTAHRSDLGFVTETAAHDLGVLCERAFEHAASCHDALLGIFLEVDKEAETRAEEQALRGVRKAQVKLATFYLAKGAPTHADRIAADMRAEKPERLASIRSEFLAVAEREFWEVTDRGVNFDFLEDARKQKLDEFFARVR
ncbi:MAG: DUF2254 domain-containing protein [Deltaproteobacteria bacterium]|nr:DUF2254 domain-containing protein [Deltaproteobacteria bacterium]